MTLDKAKKMSYIVNTAILMLVLGLMAFFRLLEVSFLVTFSIPTICVYLIGYFLIYKGFLHVYVWMVYIWITLYMGLCTVFLGYGYGFHLYCFSMIPVMFVTEYIAYKLDRRSLKAVHVSLVIAGFYLICTGYVAYYGPIYERDQKMAAVFWLLNAMIVFSFLIFYTNYLIKMIIKSENQLREMAQIDRLTKLYNRHYMLDRLERMDPDSETGFIAMADIDNFKMINDRYGHSGGDQVLSVIAEKMKRECESCEVARWGGEEFIVLSDHLSDGAQRMEKLRRLIEKEPIEWENEKIPVTITIGVAQHGKGCTIDNWIREADEKLYKGKNSGKNKVVY